MLVLLKKDIISLYKDLGEDPPSIVTEANDEDSFIFGYSMFHGGTLPLHKKGSPTPKALPVFSRKPILSKDLGE